ncbi:Alpha-xylosidase, partial [Haemophilus influenzae]
LLMEKRSLKAIN